MTNIVIDFADAMFSIYTMVKSRCLSREVDMLFKYMGLTMMMRDSQS